MAVSAKPPERPSTPGSTPAGGWSRPRRELFARVRRISARTEYAGVGEGGDRTLVIDRRAEDVVFAELERAARRGRALHRVSEERGEVAFGDGRSPRGW